LLYAFLYGYVAVHLSINIMLAHITHSKFNPYGKLYAFAIIALSILAIGASVQHTKAINVEKSVLGLTIVVTLSYWVYVSALIYELAHLLGISVFLTKQTVQRIQAPDKD